MSGGRWGSLVGGSWGRYGSEEGCGAGLRPGGRLGAGGGGRWFAFTDINISLFLKNERIEEEEGEGGAREGYCASK